VHRPSYSVPSRTITVNDRSDNRKPITIIDDRIRYDISTISYNNCSDEKGHFATNLLHMARDIITFHDGKWYSWVQLVDVRIELNDEWQLALLYGWRHATQSFRLATNRSWAHELPYGHILHQHADMAPPGRHSLATSLDPLHCLLNLSQRLTLAENEALTLVTSVIQWYHYRISPSSSSIGKHALHDCNSSNDHTAYLLSVLDSCCSRSGARLWPYLLQYYNERQWSIDWCAQYLMPPPLYRNIHGMQPEPGASLGWMLCRQMIEGMSHDILLTRRRKEQVNQRHHRGNDWYHLHLVMLLSNQSMNVNNITGHSSWRIQTTATTLLSYAMSSADRLYGHNRNGQANDLSWTTVYDDDDYGLIEAGHQIAPISRITPPGPLPSVLAPPPPPPHVNPLEIPRYATPDMVSHWQTKKLLIRVELYGRYLPPSLGNITPSCASNHLIVG
jgi:hypothetical protein